MGRKERELTGSLFRFGYSLIELVTVLLILGILSVAIMPRFWGSTFDQARFFDETTAVLRYAHRSAMTMQRTVCVAFTTPPTRVTLTYDQNYGGAACTLDLRGPDGSAPFRATAPANAGFTALPANFSYDRAGKPSNPQTMSLRGGFQIAVEAETGYVR